MTYNFLIPAVLFGLEVFHFVAHIIVMCGVRLPPRQHLASRVPFFVLDLATVTASFLVTGKAWWLAVGQNLLHLVYIVTWNKSSWARRVISWSSLEWNESRLQAGLVIGTSFDIATHAYYAFELSRLLPLRQAAIALLVSCVTIYLYIFGKSTEWRKPAPFNAAKAQVASVNQ